MKGKIWVGVFLCIVAVFVLTLTGILAHPLKLVRRVSRKAIYPCKVDIHKKYETPVLPVEYNWNIVRPNVSLFSVSMGGFGNILITLASAFEACIEYGLRPPILSIENEGDFDFHKLSPPRYPWSESPQGVTEFFPWIGIAVSDSFLGIRFILHDQKIWKATSLDSFPTNRNVIQIVDYAHVMKISDRAFDMVRRSINPKIFDYIRQNYQIAPRTMAVHLRLGQPTDDFVPASPTSDQIVQFHKDTSADHVMLFTDNPGAADAIMKQTGLTYSCVNDTNYIECLLLSMCEYAIISESTFAVSACRLGNMKNVRLPNINNGFKQDDSWTTF